MPYSDPQKQKAAQAASYEKNKERYARNNRVTKRKRKEWLDGLKQQPCKDCGQTFPPCVMDFHHRDKTEKVARIAQAILTMGRERLLAEIAKCDLICANCHRIREYT